MVWIVTLAFFFGQIFLNNSFALDSTWIYPEESRLFHGYEKPHLLANQVAVSLSRPAPASRSLPTVVLAPQPIPGWCPISRAGVLFPPAPPFCSSHKWVSSRYEHCICHFNETILLNSFSNVSFLFIGMFPFDKEMEFGVTSLCLGGHGIWFKMKRWQKGFSRTIFLVLYF